MNDSTLKNLTAKVFWAGRDNYSGTAWLCSPQHLVTARHCVIDPNRSDVNQGPFRLLFLWGEVKNAEVVWQDLELDVALLAVKPDLVLRVAKQIEEIRSARVLDRRPASEKSWTTFGFPFAKQSGMTLHGSITDFHAFITDQFSSPAIQLECNEGGFLAAYDFQGKPVSAYGEGIQALTGASGAAVLHENEIIGVVRAGPPKLGQKVVFATPLSAIAEKYKPFAEILQQHQQNRINRIRRHWLRWESEEVRPRLVNDYLEGRPDILNIHSPIYELWFESQLDRSWHEVIATTLKIIRDWAAEVRELEWLIARIDSIDPNVAYEKIVTDLKKLLRTDVRRVKEIVCELEDAHQQSVKQKDHPEVLRRFEKALVNARSIAIELYNLSQELEPPLFRRCFLITGSLGAGKTHFLKDLLALPSSKDYGKDFLVLPLILPAKDTAITDLLLSRIAGASGESDWQDLDEFCRLIAENQTADAPGSNKRPLHLVIAIDDLDKWIFLRGDEFVRELTEFISAKTVLHNLYWVITHNNASYDRIAGDSFWARYASVRALPRQKFLELEYRSANFGGWYFLDSFNESRRTGVEIIRAVYEENAAEEEIPTDQFEMRLWLLQSFDKQGSTIRNLSNPFIGWIVAGLIEDEIAAWQTLDLSYVSFVSTFWKKRKRILQPVLANPQINQSNLSEDDLDRLVWIVAKAFSQFPDLYPVRSALIREAVKLAEEFSVEPRDLTAIESIISILNQGNLLRPVNAPDENTTLGIPPEQRVETLIETFWEYYIAKGIAKPESLTVSQAKTIWTRLKTVAEREDIREGICIFFLLLLAKSIDKPKIDQFISKLLQLATKSGEDLSSAVWFAGQKSDEEFQRKLVELVGKRPLHFSRAHTLYAFMAFVGDCSPRILSAVSRLNLLQPYYRQIQESSLSQFYYFVARRISRLVTLRAEVNQWMHILTGCEEMDCAPQLAKLTVKLIRQIAREDREEMLELVIGYLQDLSLAQNFPTRVPPGKRRPYFFRELLMRELCEGLIQDHDRGTGAYWFLVDAGWYGTASWEVETWRLAEPIATEMQQQANIAFGHWFRTQFDYDPKYVKLVRKLARGELREKQTAFYLIRHTVSMKGPQDVPVANKLRPTLRKLYRDPEMQGIVASYRRFFEVNIRRAKKRVVKV